MKGNKSFYTGAILIATVIFLSGLLGRNILNFGARNLTQETAVENTKYGSFLAAQHAVYINDFESAAEMIKDVDANYETVNQIKTLTDFLNGKLPESATSFKDSKDLSARLIYDAYLIDKDDWKSLYQRHSKDDSIFTAPIRIFAAVKQGKSKDAIKHVNSLKTNDSWKAFVRGQIAVLNNDIDTATKEFADVHPDFMNINDYLYLMSFYRENGMTEDMQILRDDFVAKPGGMYVLNYNDIPDWSNYTGYKNNLVFSIIQNISHTQFMIFTDLSLMMLKFASVISEDFDKDAINYYLGQYYFYNNGDYKQSFNSVSKTSPLYLFGQMKIAEKAGNIPEIIKIAKKNPLFIPAVTIAVGDSIKRGDKNTALKIVNRALKQKNLSEAGRIYFLKHRANIYLMFNKPNKAQSDLDEIQEIDDTLTPDFMLLQARIWAMNGENLDQAYDFAMTLIKRNTSDVLAWDVLGVIVDLKEGTFAGLELFERITEVSVNVSSVYEHLGDLYVKNGDKDKAKVAYKHAVELADDGLIVVPTVERKIRKLK